MNIKELLEYIEDLSDNAKDLDKHIKDGVVKKPYDLEECLLELQWSIESLHDDIKDNGIEVTISNTIKVKA